MNSISLCFLLAVLYLIVMTGIACLLTRKRTHMLLVGFDEQTVTRLKLARERRMSLLDQEFCEEEAYHE